MVTSDLRCDDGISSGRNSAMVAAQVRTLAKARRLSANRVLLELFETGIEAERRKQEFFDLAERFRSATDSKEAKRLGDQMGRMIFGG
ncbi:MAG: hypothetical protein LAP38_13040 [Acidobacteriia bacterium]|nr:hypothetical protein [Terriglobia bacterium]